MKQDDINGILAMAHSGLGNYILPGLTSYLIGGGPSHGCVRLFQCSREHQENITPHSHRFDFRALVLKGRVLNIIWSKDPAGDEYQSSALIYDGGPGKYKMHPGEVARWRCDATTYVEGEWYGMKAEDIHSIEFSREALVLFFEGPNISAVSLILEPHVNGQTIPTFETKPWMFTKE